MRSNPEIYNEVAERCGSYDTKMSSCCTNSVASSATNAVSTNKSCLNCKHFAEEEYCRLDLYDSIARNL